MLRLSSIGRLLLIGGAAAILAAACGGSTAGSPSPSPVDVGQGSLVGAGATFPGPFYTKAFADYSAKYPQVTINYQSVGSGAGIKQFQAKTVDFGASDVPMGSADITTAGGSDALTQIPTTLGVISIAYNISGVSSLNLDGPTLANIYLGHIKNWNNADIAALNSGTTLPNKPIIVAHRADSSGTSYHFTDYLAKVSDEWKTKVGVAKAVSWPVSGNGGQGNQGVAQIVQSTDGALGYVELAYVVQTGMKQAAIKNANGKFVQASVAGATAAAGTNTSVSPTNFSITNAACDACYPISGFSWVILYTNYTDATKGKAVVYLFKWLVTSGQSDGSDLQYAPLPSSVQQLALTNLKLIKSGGSPILR
ncbi:MAG TPA: phosphate ABC transporter substrate-binding protein PstS [Candidatus Limnocylindrales bacterium]|nr:phosphate ABC transporter substrate-binding protein PstS [Candidatus Limnocylindrales bacterium]